MSEWIKCSDRLPPVRQQILAYGPGRGEYVNGVKMDICIWDGDQWWDEGGTEQTLEGYGGGGWKDVSWTHWMPIPKPPHEATA